VTVDIDFRLLESEFHHRLSSTPTDNGVGGLEHCPQDAEGRGERWGHHL
jgi:hypothetical protein